MDVYVILWHGAEEWIDELTFKTESEAETHAGLCLLQMEYNGCEYRIEKTHLVGG